MGSPDLNRHADAVAHLRNPATIRTRAHRLLTLAEKGALSQFTYHPEHLDAAVVYVVAEIKRNYPTLAVPYHSRWRHFEAGGIDRWAKLAPSVGDHAERARVRIDLAVTSVLLDAGAGPAWTYREAASGQVLARSEGLAIASFAMFTAGGFSARQDRPLRADAAALIRLTEAELERGFQVSEDNPLVGTDGRTALMNRLGQALAARPDLFGTGEPRVGNLYDSLAARVTGGKLPVSVVLATVLDGLSTIWPGRIALGSLNLGDVWRHPAIHTDDLTDGLMPFHKLSQWLTYSLLEPLQEAGIAVTDLDALTGLPEYRNGGLFLDLGVLAPQDPAALERIHGMGDVFVVELRALTVALLDRMAQRVRDKLGVTAAALPLASVLQGGTWSAGRRIAAELRYGGTPPIRLDSDGTVF